MRIATLVVTALLATVVVASAQTPFIAVYFDQYYTQEAKDCPGVGMLDSWYVVARNANCFVTGAEFMIDYPAVTMWLSDAGTPPVTIGNTASGISMGFGLPLNGYNPVLLCTVNVMWMSDCAGTPTPLRVVQNPNTLYLGLVDFPNYELVPAVGLTATLCPPTVPTEESTWGQVKALYE